MIAITLTVPVWECLLEAVPEESPAHLALDSAVELTGSALNPEQVVIECTRDVALVLYGVARKSCREAANDIWTMINHAKKR